MLKQINVPSFSHVATHMESYNIHALQWTEKNLLTVKDQLPTGSGDIRIHPEASEKEETLCFCDIHLCHLS